MMEINFRRLVFQVGERERKMHNKNLNCKNEGNNNCYTPAEKGINGK